MKIKNNLNLLIKYTNTNSTDLAKKANIASVAIYNYKNNKNTPNVDSAYKMIKYFEKEKNLHITLGEFFNIEPITPKLKNWVSNNIDLSQSQNQAILS